MAEQFTKLEYSIINHLPHPVLKFLKLSYREYRFNKASKLGKSSLEKFKSCYNYKILFIAGLPKSGTSWLEKMLSSYKGYTIIPDPDITKWDYQNYGTHNFELSPTFFSRLEGTLTLVKIHCHGSKNNTSLLKQMDIPYCIIYRDLRDAAVSYVFYVKRTPWHPEYPVYKKLTIQEGLIHFGITLLSEWRNWIEGWQRNRDTQKSIIIKYENLLAKPNVTFRNVVNLFNLPEDNLQKIIKNHQFHKMKHNGSFFRKGKSGDWQNHFNSSIKTLYKEKIADFLINEGYENNDNW